MPSALETRLEAALAAAPASSIRVRARARAAALDALPSRRRLPRRALAVAATVGAFAAAAAGLAATGTVHVALGPARPAVHVVPRLVLPPSARGIAVVAGGRLWLTMRGGTRIEGLPVSTAELSPRALYVAVGLRRTLVAMAPDGRRAWALPVNGTVRAIAWAPDGLLVAYVVDTGRTDELRVVEGDGDHDTLLARDVGAVRPTWRADSLALAYVDGSGRVRLDDRARGRTVLVGGTACAGRIGALAFAPHGTVLAAGGARGLYVGAADGSGRCTARSARASGVAWAGSELVAAQGGPIAASRTGVVVRSLSRRLADSRGTTLLTLPRGAEVTAVAVR